jgi:hypothetical protein
MKGEGEWKVFSDRFEVGGAYGKVFFIVEWPEIKNLIVFCSYLYAFESCIRDINNFKSM